MADFVGFRAASFERRERCLTLFAELGLHMGCIVVVVVGGVVNVVGNGSSS